MNDGVILGKRDSDYLGGTLPYEVRNPSGDWTPYLPPGEFQYSNKVDYMACVTFSALNSIEMQYKLITGQSLNFSDRFTAKMSGTLPEGNWLWKVGDSIRLDGIVEEQDWPTNPDYDWSQYYAEIPQAVKDKAKLFLQSWEVKYEFIDWGKSSLLYHLKHAPIQVVIPGHAVVNIFNNQDIYRYFDSYQPFVKDRNDGFVQAMKIVLNKKSMSDTEVKNLYLLAFYRLPDAGELAYWKGKPLNEFLKTAIKDRANYLEANINE